MDIQLFKIKLKDKELYSTGGGRPNFTKKGKNWSSIHHLKRHLKFFILDDERKAVWQNNIPEDWEVLEINMDKPHRLYSAKELFAIESPYMTEEQSNLYVRTILRVRYSGKWVEYTFVEDLEPEGFGYSKSTKAGDLDTAIRKYLNYSDVITLGIRFVKTLWTIENNDWKLLGFCDAKGKLLKEND